MLIVSAPEQSGKAWGQQGLQLPGPLLRGFKAEASRHSNGVKRLGTLGIAMALGMPPRVRQIMMVWVDLMTAEGEEAITPEAAWQLFQHAMRMNDEHPDNASWFAAILASPRQPLLKVATDLDAAAAPPRPPTSQEKSTHVVDRILDPNVSLPPGIKPKSPDEQRRKSS